MSKSTRMQAQVKFYNREKGYGFLKRPNIRPDIFFSQQDLAQASIDHVRENDVLEFDLLPVQGKGGKAANLKFIMRGPK